MHAGMFCPHCIQSMRVPTKSKCFIRQDVYTYISKNELVSLGKDLLAAKLNYLQGGGCCCCKKVKKNEKFIYIGKKSPPNIFFPMKEGISIRNYLRNPIKMIYKYDFWRELVVYVVKKEEKKSYLRTC